MMLATICGRFRLKLAEQMGGMEGVLERQISSFTLAVDGGLHIHFHDRSKVPHASNALHDSPYRSTNTYCTPHS